MSQIAATPLRKEPTEIRFPGPLFFRTHNRNHPRLLALAGATAPASRQGDDPLPPPVLRPRHTPQRVSLAKMSLIRVRAERGTILRCPSGTLWLTPDRDPIDIVLDAGNAFIAKSRCEVLICALDAAQLEITGAACPSFRGVIASLIASLIARLDTRATAHDVGRNGARFVPQAA